MARKFRNNMTPAESIQTVRAELEAGAVLPQCRKCGCMESTLKNLAAVLPTVGRDDASLLAASISGTLGKMDPVQYACLGCEHCYPAVAQNAFGLAFPALSQAGADLSCEFQVRAEGWPPVVGEYFVVDQAAPVAVSTLASSQLAEELVQRQPTGLAIIGKTETENIGIDKIIKNVITNPSLSYLIVAGLDPKGHLVGKTLLALAENGVGENGRVLGSPGKRPILRNLSAVEIEAFRKQVHIIDMIGCESVDKISVRIEALSAQVTSPCACSDCGDPSPVPISTAPKIVVTPSGDPVEMDTAGYFVIVPLADQGIINVEHYAYDNALLRVIEGPNVKAIYTMLTNNGWVTELSHAAYLGRELTKAELSLQHGFKYVQDGA